MEQVDENIVTSNESISEIQTNQDIVGKQSVTKNTETITTFEVDGCDQTIMSETVTLKTTFNEDVLKEMETKPSTKEIEIDEKSWKKQSSKEKVNNRA